MSTYTKNRINNFSYKNIKGRQDEKKIEISESSCEPNLNEIWNHVTVSKTEIIWRMF